MVSQQSINPYQPQNHIRIVTSASLFDGHDAAINIMRRIMQASGAEVIHLGHNRSVAEIVDCAIQEDVQGIAITSYQGGHLEYFKYVIDLLRERKADHILVFGGGGGTIPPSEIEELQRYGVTRLYSPDDGRLMGLQGMINDLLEKCDHPTGTAKQLAELNGQLTNLPQTKDARLIGQLISVAENEPDSYEQTFKVFKTLKVSKAVSKTVPVLGITGTGGAGKSSLVDELVRRFLVNIPEKTIAIISVDPSKRKTGGALLGDRIRMNAIHPDLAVGRVYMRSLATRQANLALSKNIRDAIDICKVAQFDLIIIETSGIGQSDTEITEHSDVSLYVMTAEYGAATQLEKIDMLDFADAITINKFDKRGSLDALRDVRKQYRRNHAATNAGIWEIADEELPIFGTVASQFNDGGMNALFSKLMQFTSQKTGVGFLDYAIANSSSFAPSSIIPAERVRYLAEIVETSDQYDLFVNEQVAIARKMYQLDGVLDTLSGSDPAVEDALKSIYADFENRLHHDCRQLLKAWPEMKQKYRADTYQYQVRDKTIHQSLFSTSLSGLRIPKISLPVYAETPGRRPYADVCR
jgi:methylmalonyl-CoA mutase